MQAAAKIEPKLPELVYDFETPEQIKDWEARRGDWNVADGKLLAKSEETNARIVLQKVFQGRFEAVFTAERSGDGFPPIWGCTLFDDTFGHCVRLEFDSRTRWARLSSADRDEHSVLCSRPLGPAFFERGKVPVSIEGRDGFITVRDDQRALLVAWDEGKWLGRFGLLASGPMAFDDLRIRSQPDENAELVHKAIEAQTEQHRWDCHLSDWQPIPLEHWKQAEGKGEGVSVEGEMVRLRASGVVWRLFGEENWDRYMVDLEARTESWATVLVGGTASGSGYLIEFPANPIHTVHMHRFRDGVNEAEMPATTQAVRLVPGEWYRIRVFVSPIRVVVYLNGLRLYDFPPTAYSHGKFGIFGWSGVAADYRNIRIAMPPKPGEPRDIE
jgi:hypothetical protein